MWRSFRNLWTLLEESPSNWWCFFHRSGAKGDSAPESTNPGWWFGTWIVFFHSVGNFMIPTDEVIFFRGVAISICLVQCFASWFEHLHRAHKATAVLTPWCRRDPPRLLLARGWAWKVFVYFPGKWLHGNQTWENPPLSVGISHWKTFDYRRVVSVVWSSWIQWLNTIIVSFWFGKQFRIS